jgi:hypothetical protein
MISRFWLLGGLVLAVVLVGPARIGERLQGWMTNRAPIVTSSADPVAVEIEPEWVTFALDRDVPQTLVFTDQQQAYVWDVMFDGNRAHGVFSTPSSSYAAAGVWQTSSTALALLASNDRGEIVAQATATLARRSCSDGAGPSVVVLAVGSARARSCRARELRAHRRALGRAEAWHELYV